MFSAPSQLITVEVDTIESEEQKLKKSFVKDVTLNQFKIVATFDLQQCLKAAKPIAPVEIKSEPHNFQDIELRLAINEKRKEEELTKIKFTCRVVP